MQKIFNFCFLIIFVFSAFLFSFQDVAAAGASLYIAPASGTHVIGSTFTVSVKVNTGGQVINAAEGSLSFDSDLIEFVSASRSGAVFNLWTTEPSLSGTNVIFGGGIPGQGYNGTAGHVCSITFRTKKAGNANIRFTSGAVLANDGKGTNVLSSMGSAAYVIAPKVAPPPTTNTDNTNTKPSTKTDTPKIEKKEEIEYNKPIIVSETHSDQNKWFNGNNIKFSWKLPENVEGVSVLLDENSVADPGPKSDGLFDSKEYFEVEDGIHYLHLKFRDGNRWGTIAHYRIMIDTMPPKVFEAKVETEQESDWPVLYFETKDDDSGMEKYEIIVGSLEEHSFTMKADDKFLSLKGLEVGEHTAMVRAIDKAGNERVSTINFRINPIDTPEILNYPHEFRSSDNFYMNGIAVENAKVNVYIQKENQIIASSTVQADSQGNWFYIYDANLDNGRYVAWVEAINDKGIKSDFSKKVSFLVTPPIFTTIGDFVVDYFTVFVSLIFMIVLIVILILFVMSLIRKKLRKETVEVEHVLHSNLEDLKKIVDQEFTKLKKYENTEEYNKEKQKMKLRLKKKIEVAEKSIMKEVLDVEEILK